MSEVRLSRSQMSAKELEARSQLNFLAGGAGMLRGSLSERATVCGKPTCHCATGERHRALVLVISTKGKTKQVHIPREHESTVRLWVKNYQKASRALQRIADLRLIALREG
jgi:hypothetical protein